MMIDIMETTNKQNVEPVVNHDKHRENVLLADFIYNMVQKNLTEEELNTLESTCADFVKSNPIHEWCYRVWVKSFYEGEDADMVEEKFGMYERVFTEKSDVDEYKKKVEYDLGVLGYHPFENAYKFYDCAVMDSTLLLNWNNVRFW